MLNFEEPNKPVLLEGCIDNWGALRNWDRDYLVRLCGDEQKRKMESKNAKKDDPRAANSSIPWVWLLKGGKGVF